MFCSKCGNEIKEGSKFCNNCGNPIVSNTKKGTPVSNDRTTPNTKTPQKEPESLLSNIQKKPIIFGIIILICGVLLYSIFSFVGSRSESDRLAREAIQEKMRVELEQKKSYLFSQAKEIGERCVFQCMMSDYQNPFGNYSVSCSNQCQSEYLQRKIEIERMYQ